jgi:hypothetical protein
MESGSEVGKYFVGRDCVFLLVCVYRRRILSEDSGDEDDVSPARAVRIVFVSSIVGRYRRRDRYRDSCDAVLKGDEATLLLVSLFG